MSRSQPLQPFRRLYHRLLRRRVVRERGFGQPTLLQRLLRIRLGSALALSAPALALCLWYSYVAIVAHARHNLAAGLKVPLTVELFHLHLHDKLTQDLGRLGTPEPLSKSALPTYDLVLSNDALDQLGKMLPPVDGRSRYVNAHIERGRRVYPVEVRYRGSKHWHWNHPQKSWKVRAKPGALVEGRQTFNFINTPEPMPFEEQLILEVAREQGLLTPDYFPFRLLLNRAFMGLYFFESQPNEDLLRRAKRMPGSIYSGNEAPLDPKTGISTLWDSAKLWKKVSGIDKRHLKDFSELEALIDAVNNATSQQFEEFARDHIDIEKAALFDALDVVFGVNQHDFHQNHKLYFDPYRGKFEPIAWNFRGAKHQRVFNRTENPLLLRLKDLPSYATLRNRIAYGLLHGSCGSKALRSRSQALLDRLSEDQIRDPYWDAYQLLPPMGTYYRQLVRPMDLTRQALVLRTRLDEHARREQYLLEMLSKHEIRTELAPVQEHELSVPGPADKSNDEADDGADTGDGARKAFVFAIDVAVGGVSGYRLEEVKPIWPKSCTAESWQLLADSNLDGIANPPADERLTDWLSGNQPAKLSLEVFPRTRLKSRGRVHPHRGGVRTTSETSRYRFFGVSDRCAPDQVFISGKSLVTDRAFQSESSPPVAEDTSQPPAADPPTGCTGTRFRIEPGYVSPHPWCFEPKRAESVRLGPGIVEVNETRVFGREQSVVIAPGTTFRLAKKASLVFLGRVDARGTPDAPIRFEPKKKRWGGVALQGAGTAGSRLSHVHFSKGTAPKWRFVHFPGMVNVHDTSDIEISHAFFHKNKRSDDALHVAYVQDLRLRDATFRKAAFDAVDIEFSSATIDRLTAVKTGDEPVDLMGSQVLLRSCRLVKWGGSAISVGEETDVLIRDCIAANGNHGIHIKNASRAFVDGVLLYRNSTAVRIEYLSEWYSGRSRLAGDLLHAVRCGEQVQVEGGQFKGVGRIADQIDAGQLTRLRTKVLGIADWNALDEVIDELCNGRKP